MKHPLASRLLAAAALFPSAFFVSAAHAQITISSTDVDRLLTQEFPLRQAVSLNNPGIDALIALSGADRRWDFTSLSYDVEFSGSYGFQTGRAPSPSSEFEHLAATTHTLIGRVFGEFEEFGETFDVRNLSYLVKTPDELLVLGEQELATFGFEGEEDTISFAGTYSPGLVDLRFPVSFGSSWSSSVQHSIHDFTGGTGPTYTVHDSREIDGWGTLIRADGEFAALRMTVEQERTGPGGTSIMKWYYFLGADGLPLAVIEEYDDGEAIASVNYF